LGTSLTQAQTVTVTVIPSVGPHEGIAVDGYTYNALNSLIGAPLPAAYSTAYPTGVANSGTAPASYSGLSNPALINTNQLVATTSVPSWMGQANPGGAYSGQFGNEVFFGASLIGGSGGPKFSLNDVSYSVASASNPGFNSSGSFAGDVYNQYKVGVDFGANGVLGGGDDTYYFNGQAGSQLVDAIYLNSISAFFQSNATDQAGLSADIASLGTGPIDLTGTFSVSNAITGASGSSSAGVNAVIPEPASMAILGVGLVGLLGYTYRRRQAVSAMSC